ncbi:MBL fold metallo-hydrolase [Goodfellowiella coeruleoviolacea]|uniref:Metallo-beta-lactamase superfamily protein n=1 Tax=Goodfellowiella coeruleoviolacea TaxID=334858 RepID=A0AAE3GE39_9PSEU|nr:MBL fold metallo-hydrolase [Goodfellowiella coeruleoviolacea]MCP2166601.1 Metallo-beta-lactamase superfamily protein [Goodfellowiella coeruleoviolacea]
MTIWICGTCGVEHPDTARPPAEDCRVCADERQYVPRTGQVWTTLDQLAATTRELVREEVEPGIHRFHQEPEFAIGQWSYLVRTEAGNLLWDPPNHLDESLVAAIGELGGVAVVVASHPHMYGSQVSWSHRFGRVPVLVHAADRRWVRREDPVIREWRGTEQVLPGVTLVEAGGHFPGAAVAHVAAGAGGRGTLLTGDTIMPVADHGWVTFMRSYPNAIPLSAGLVRRIVDRLEPYQFHHLYSLVGGPVVTDAKNAVRRSAERYIAWVSGANDHLG